MSAKGLEWALRLRADLQNRIEQLREALAGIEPLRQELVRLEEQLRGVERLVAVYHEQLGYPKTAEEIAPAPQLAVSREELTRQIEAALVPLHAPEPAKPPAPASDEAPDILVALRSGVTRFWFSLRIWFAERFLRRDSLS